MLEPASRDRTFLVFLSAASLRLQRSDDFSAHPLESGTNGTTDIDLATRTTSRVRRRRLARIEHQQERIQRSEVQQELLMKESSRG